MVSISGYIVDISLTVQQIRAERDQHRETTRARTINGSYIRLVLRTLNVCSLEKAAGV